VSGSVPAQHRLDLIVIDWTSRSVLAHHRLDFTVVVESTGFNRAKGCRSLGRDLGRRRTGTDTRLGDAKIAVLAWWRSDGLGGAKVAVDIGCASGCRRERAFHCGSVGRLSGTGRATTLIGCHPRLVLGFCSCAVLFGLVECIGHCTGCDSPNDTTEHGFRRDATGQCRHERAYTTARWC
jgi:hypothetical protein